MAVELFKQGLELFADQWQAPGTITLQPSGDLDDYISLSTTSNRPCIAGTGNYLVMGTDATSGHTIGDTGVIFGGITEFDGMAYLDGGATIGTSFNILDDILFTLGTDNDQVMLNRSTSLAADAEVTGVVEGTSDHLGNAANSLIISNITNDGDIHILASKAGNSYTAFLADGSAGDTILNAATGASVDVYIAGTKEIDYATGALAFQQATTLSTTTGALTIDGDDGIILQTTGSGLIQAKEIISVGTGEGGLTLATGLTVRAPDITTGGAGNVAGADLTIAAGLGTGTGDAGQIIFQTPQVATAGDNIQTLETILTLDEDLATFAKPIVQSGTSTTAFDFTGTFNQGINFDDATLSIADSMGRNRCFIGIGTYGDHLSLDLSTAAQAGDRCYLTQMFVDSTANPGNAAMYLQGAYYRINVTTADQANLSAGVMCPTLDVDYDVKNAYALKAELDMSATGLAIGQNAFAISGYLEVATSGALDVSGSLGTAAVIGGFAGGTGLTLTGASRTFAVMAHTYATATATAVQLINAGGTVTDSALLVDGYEGVSCPVGIHISTGTIGLSIDGVTTDISLQNGETISNATDGTIAVNGYFGLLMTDTDGDGEGEIWYDASENTIKVCTGSTDSVVLLTATQELDNKTLDSSVAKGTWTASGTWTIPAVTLGGAVSGNAQTISNANVTVGASRTLDVSAGTLTLAADQISGDKVEGGTINAITINTLTSGTAVTMGDTTAINTGVADDDYFTIGAVDNDTNVITECMRFVGAATPNITVSVPLASNTTISATTSVTTNAFLASADASYLQATGGSSGYFDFKDNAGAAVFRLRTATVSAIEMVNAKAIRTATADSDYFIFQAIDNDGADGAFLEVARVASANDPYLATGGSQQFKFYNSGTALFGSVVTTDAATIEIGAAGVIKSGATNADTMLLASNDTTFITFTTGDTDVCTIANATMSGTWLASGTVTVPALTLGGAIAGGDQSWTGVGDMTFTAGSILASGSTNGNTLILKANDTAFITFTTGATDECEIESATMKGTWLADGTVTVPALTLGGAIAGGDQAFTGVGDMTFTAGSILAATETNTGTLLIKAGGLSGTSVITITSLDAGDTLGLANVTSLVATGNLDIGAFTLTASQLISDIAAGTAPLVVASNTLVSNLNADLLDGNEAAAFAAASHAMSTHSDEDTYNINTSGSATIGGTVTIPVALTGVIRADSGVLSVDADVTDIVTAATTSAAGKIEIAIASEVDTGTDATRAVSPDALAGSIFGEKIIYIKVVDAATALTTGDGKAYITVPDACNGMNLVDADIAVYTTSSSGNPTVQLNNLDYAGGAQDMLSTEMTIDAGGTELSSYTAAAPPVINASYDDVATGNRIRVDVDAAGTGTKGLDVILTFALP